MRGETKVKRLGLIGSIALAVVALGMVCMQGIASGDEIVSTGAVVTGSSVAPRIECKWELPDMRPNVVGIQYDSAIDPDVHDDDMAVVPDADNDPTNGIQVPCTGPPTTVPSMPGGVMSMIQVRPNAEDMPEERQIELWAAVDHPNGIAAIDDVYWVIYHPDRSPKVQVHGTKVPNTAGDCDALGHVDQPGSMFNAAYATGQIAAESIEDINKGMIAKCQQSEKAIYYAKFDLSKHQPCGVYKVELHAISSGAETILVNYIDVICTYYMEIDFSAVNWETITPGVKDVVSGDLIFDAAEVPSAPTVKNTGNSGMGVGVHFSEMLQQGVDPVVAKRIDQFDACFGKSPAGIQCVDPIMASDVVWFGDIDDPDRVLCSNDVGKLDVSIHPPTTLPGGTYAGTMDILARALPSPNVCPTDQGHLPPPP
jgi:hypothetical protein